MFTKNVLMTMNALATRSRAHVELPSVKIPLAPSPACAQVAIITIPIYKYVFKLPLGVEKLFAHLAATPLDQLALIVSAQEDTK